MSGTEKRKTKGREVGLVKLDLLGSSKKTQMDACIPASLRSDAVVIGKENWRSSCVNRKPSSSWLLSKAQCASVVFGERRSVIRCVKVLSQSLLSNLQIEIVP